ncbi:uncharacterized protein [Antedon mediterranea]|uniref:uncharacterized protein n=1 Tax=Antedon mediterranea TaxID=105859 RepID=UPI003AF5BC29
MTITRSWEWLSFWSLMLTVFLEYSVGQSITKLTAESQFAIEGQETTTLPCYFIPTNAVIGKYYWKKNETVIARKDDAASRYSLSDPKQGDTAGYVSLTINAVSRQDEGSYTCGVNDESTGATILFQTKCSLTVYYLDTPTLMALGDLEAVRGSKVSMSCNLKDAYPKQITRTWFHGNKILKEIPGKINFKNDILEIETFDESNKGNYSCKVENESELGKNEKASNSITYRLKDEVTAPPSTSSSGAIIATFVILAIVVIVILGVVYVIYSRKKEQRDIYTIIETITNNKASHKLIQHLTDTPGDLKEKYDIQPVKVNKDLVKDEPITFKFGEIVVPRGSDVAAPFELTYTDQLLDIITISGYKEPYFDFVLKPNKKNQDKTKIYQPNISLNCKSKISKGVKGAEGSLESRSVTDDDEGRFGCFVNVKQEPKQSGAKPTTRFRFGGELGIRLTNAVHRNTDGRLLSSGGVVLNNRAFLLLNDHHKYIMCRGIPDMTQEFPTRITWDEEANVLIQAEKELLSYAVLPGKHTPYILIGVVNVSKSKSRIKRKLIVVLPNKNPLFRIMNDVIKILESNGSVEDLKFDYLSGKKLSTGRLVVGGWVKRKGKTNENGRHGQTNEFRVKYLPLSTQKQADVEKQSFSYQPFILWTENEIDWNIVYLKMENAEDNMRIQIIETDNDKVRAIVSLLQSCKVVYEGVSNDNCTTFLKKEQTSTTYMPVVSVALSSDGKFICVPAINKTDDAKSNHKETSASATKEPLNTERKQGVLADLKNSVKNLVAPVTNQQPQNENQNLGETKDDNPNTDVPQAGTNETDEEKTTDATTRKRGVLGKVSKTLSSIKSKKKPISDAEYESVPTNEESNETPKEEKAGAVVKEKETEVKQVEDIQGTSQQEPDESTPCVHEEESKEIEKRRSFIDNVKHGITKPFKTEGKSKKKTKKESKTIEEEDPTNQEREKLKFEGLWHFLEDTTDNRIIRLKPIHAGSGKDYKPIDILQNRSKVKCEQIVPFMSEGKSGFLMIYTTNFEEDEDLGHCIRYHVLSLDFIKESLKK